MRHAPLATTAAASLPLLQRPDIKSVVLFRALQLGDMLCAVPALRAIRAALPHARITLVGLPWAEQFAARYPRYLDEFIAFPGHPALPEQPVQEEKLAGFYADMRKRQFDLAVQLHGSGQLSNGIVQDFSARVMAGYCAGAIPVSERAFFTPYPDSGPEPLRLLQLASFLGAASQGDHLEFPLTPADRLELQDSGLAPGLQPGTYLCVHPGARHRDKCWAPEKFAQVADVLAEEFGLTVVLTGSSKEVDLAGAVQSHMRAPAVNAAGPISIGAMAALMEGARLLVCNDTGVSHIAAGLRLPSVVIFSKADMQRWAPLNGHLHRCLWDPEGKQVQAVLEQARDLLIRT